jgi:CDGSH iron-sulfur domain-containing protein 3
MSEALVARRGPFEVALEAGRNYAWCACGRSESQPFCDGSHKGTGLQPVVFRPERGGTHWLCGCKRSAGRPHCDGSHETI